MVCCGRAGYLCVRAGYQLVVCALTDSVRWSVVNLVALWSADHKLWLLGLPVRTSPLPLSRSDSNASRVLFRIWLLDRVDWDTHILAGRTMELRRRRTWTPKCDGTGYPGCWSGDGSHRNIHGQFYQANGLSFLDLVPGLAVAAMGMVMACSGLIRAGAWAKCLRPRLDTRDVRTSVHGLRLE